MRRVLSFSLFAVVALCGASAEAQSFFENLKLGTSRNNTWPDPFICRDREFVAQPIAQTVANGWKRQCLLQGYHFDESSRLTQAGMHKLEWIVTQAPIQRRAVYVQRGPNAEITATRMDSVNQATLRLARTAQLPPIAETDMVDEGWSAQEVNDVTTKYRATQPDPRLKAVSDGATTQ